MTRRLLLAAVAVGIVAGASWVARQRTATPARQDFNLVIITLDTTRADRIGAYGEPSRATPNIDRLAAQGVLFEHAVAPAPLTLPAHATLFTGEDPPFHGVRDNGGYVLDAAKSTLAEQLKGRGYATGAFVGAFVLDSKFGLDQGFDQYFDSFDINRRPGSGFALGDIFRPGSEVVDAALPWLEQHAHERFFAWMHFYDPHSPYEPPEPYRSIFSDRPYLGEIAYVDAQVGRVIEWLRNRQLLERTVIVVIGDHGEMLGEHGEGTHGLFIYEGSLHVPLIVRTPDPAMRDRRVPAVVRTQDVLPTVVELVGGASAFAEAAADKEAPPLQLKGVSLVRLMRGDAQDLNLDAYSESLYARNHFGWGELRSFRSGRFKLIDAPRPELYDLEQDPKEATNVYESRRALADRLRVEVRRITQAAESGGRKQPTAIDPETRERLAALGYVGSFTNVAIPEGETLPDPKDKIGVFNRMQQAYEGKNEPIAILEQVVAEDPQIIDAWMMIGNEYAKRRQHARALGYYKRALELRPGYDLATINLANTYRRLGDDQAAMVGYQQYLDRDPRNAYVRYQLGEIQSDLGRLDDAAKTFATALDADPTLASARNALGVVRFKQGRVEEAVRDIRMAISAKPDVRLAHFNLAVIAESQGRMAEARELYLKDVELHPENHRSHFNLGRLYEAAGEREQQIAAWKASIDANPEFAEGHVLLAKLYIDSGRDGAEARRLAQRGVELAPHGQLAPLGRSILAATAGDNRDR
jgi:arylsulfatase A-like enzyme/Tfp pilus assembly protein PilF